MMLEKQKAAVEEWQEKHKQGHGNYSVRPKFDGESLNVE